MMANSKLSLAMIASMSRPAVAAAIASGSLTKADVAVINGLRANGGATEEIAKHIGRKVLRDRKLRKIGTLIGAYAKQEVQKKKEKPMIITDITARRVEKSRETQRALSEAIHEYARAHPLATREDVLSKVLYSKPVADLHKRDLEEVEKLGGAKLPQHRTTASIDFGSQGLNIAPGYDSGKDGRRPGRPHASGGPQSGEEDQPVIEDHDSVMARLVKTGMAAGMSYSKAVNAAADSQEFKDAFKAWKAKHGY